MSNRRPFEHYLEPQITRARIARQWVQIRNRVAGSTSRARWLRRATVATFVASAILLSDH